MTKKPTLLEPIYLLLTHLKKQKEEEKKIEFFFFMHTELQSYYTLFASKLLLADAA